MRNQHLLARRFQRRGGVSIVEIGFPFLTSTGQPDIRTPLTGGSVSVQPGWLPDMQTRCPPKRLPPPGMCHPCHPCHLSRITSRPPIFLYPFKIPSFRGDRGDSIDITQENRHPWLSSLSPLG